MVVVAVTEGVPTATAVVEAAVGTLTMAGEEARTEVSSCALALGCGTDTVGVAARVVGAVVILGVGCAVGRGTDVAGFTVGITVSTPGKVTQACRHGISLKLTRLKFVRLRHELLLRSDTTTVQRGSCGCKFLPLDVSTGITQNVLNKKSGLSLLFAVG